VSRCCGGREAACRPHPCPHRSFGKPRSPPVLTAPAQKKQELREAARELTEEALKTLAKICREGKSESARVAAANCLLDRGYGKPAQQVETEHTGAIEVSKVEIPDFASITDKREAVRRFQEFRQQLNQRYPPPAWPPKKVDGGQLQ
jgi:hypothetical protein